VITPSAPSSSPCRLGGPDVPTPTNMGMEARGIACRRTHSLRRRRHWGKDPRERSRDPMIVADIALCAEKDVFSRRPSEDSRAWASARPGPRRRFRREVPGSAWACGGAGRRRIGTSESRLGSPTHLDGCLHRFRWSSPSEIHGASGLALGSTLDPRRPMLWMSGAKPASHGVGEDAPTCSPDARGGVARPFTQGKLHEKEPIR